MISTSFSHPVNISEEVSVLIIQSLIASIPFIILALFLTREMKRSENRSELGMICSFVSVTLASVFLWSYIYFDTLHPPVGRGANIGLGILLALSPVYIPLLMYISNFVCSGLNYKKYRKTR